MIEVKHDYVPPTVVKLGSAATVTELSNQPGRDLVPGPGNTAYPNS